MLLLHLLGHGETALICDLDLTAYIRFAMSAWRTSEGPMRAT